jgi:hypothetical protein
MDHLIDSRTPVGRRGGKPVILAKQIEESRIYHLSRLDDFTD